MLSVHGKNKFRNLRVTSFSSHSGKAKPELIKINTSKGKEHHLKEGSKLISLKQGLSLQYQGSRYLDKPLYEETKQ